MEDREELVIRIGALLGGGVKPNIATEFYNYFCSEIKPGIAAKEQYSILVNNLNNTLVLHFNSDVVSTDNLATLFGILNQDKNI